MHVSFPNLCLSWIWCDQCWSICNSKLNKVYFKILTVLDKLLVWKHEYGLKDVMSVKALNCCEDGSTPTLQLSYNWNENKEFTASFQSLSLRPAKNIWLVLRQARFAPEDRLWRSSFFWKPTLYRIFWSFTWLLRDFMSGCEGFTGGTKHVLFFFTFNWTAFYKGETLMLDVFLKMSTGSQRFFNNHQKFLKLLHWETCKGRRRLRCNQVEL